MAISDKITSIENHLTNDWTNIEALGVDIDCDKNIENIADKLDELWENQSHIEETGTTLSMNTNKGKAKVDLLGNTSQISYSGTNLFEPFVNGSITGTQTSSTSIATAQQTFNYTRVLTFNNGEITGNPGVGNGSYYIWKATFSGLEANTKYSFGVNYEYKNLTGTTGNLIMFDGATVAQTGETSKSGLFTKVITTDENGAYVMSNFINIAPVCYNENTTMRLYNIQMIKGEYTSETMPDYEPYVGGTASPNPSYPSPVNVVSGDNTINVEGKNLLDEKGLLNATFITGVYKYTKVNFKGNRTLYFKAQLKSGKTALSGLYVALANYGSNPNAGTSAFSIRNGAVQNSGISNDFTGIEDLYIGFYPTSYTWEEISNTYDFWVSTSDITYSEYQGQKEYQVNLGVENLFDKDNVNYLNDVFIGGTGTITSGSGNTSIYIKCNANTTYTIKKEVDNVFRVGTTQNVPIVGTTTNDYKDNASGSEIPLTTSSNANYLVVFLRNASSSKTLETIINSLQITTGNHIQQISNNPLELCEIGNYKDGFIRNSGKNLLEPNTFAQNVIDTPYNPTNISTYDSTTGELNIKMGDGSAIFDDFKENTQYTIILKYNLTSSGTNLRVEYTDGTKTSLNLDLGTGIFRYVTTSGKTIDKITHIAYDSSGTKKIYLKESGIFEGVIEATDFEPYGKGEWYLNKQIGKVILTGNSQTEAWNKDVNIDTEYDYFYTSNFRNIAIITPSNFITDKFSKLTYIQGAEKNGFYATSVFIINIAKSLTGITSDDTLAQRVAKFRTWLSNNNVLVYYVLATPTYTKIEGTLASQLEDVWRANTYDNQTNVSQVNNDLPFELYFKALGTPSNTLLGLSRQLNEPLNEIGEEPIEEIEEESGE